MVERDDARSIGIVGAGQLARMLCEAASPLGIPTVVLAESDTDAAVPIAGRTIIGSPSTRDAMLALAEACDVMTFDHELVDLEIIAELTEGGHTVRPGLSTLEMATDKSVMRGRLTLGGLAVPAYTIIKGDADPASRMQTVEKFAEIHGWPLILKTAKGGYDGKGVWPVSDAGEAAIMSMVAEGALLVEEFVTIETEIAVLVGRRPGGEITTWPAVETAQVDGVCREVLYPGTLSDSTRRAAEQVAVKVAEIAGSIGVIAVEMFLSEQKLVVNEIAARPHNSGHWTIEGSDISQFEGHLRAILDLPLGRPRVPFHSVATVNVFGAEDGHDPAEGRSEALGFDGARVHLYGKAPRKGRKLGHVTVCGNDPYAVRSRAWSAARALGTPVPASLRLFEEEG